MFKKELTACPLIILASIIFFAEPSYSQIPIPYWFSVVPDENFERQRGEKFEKEHTYTAYGVVKHVSWSQSKAVIKFLADDGKNLRIKVAKNDLLIKLIDPEVLIRMSYKQLYSPYLRREVLFELLEVLVLR